MLHFIGHGGFDPVRKEGFLMLERDGELQRLYASDLASLAMPPALPPPGLVVLNCCSGAQTSPGLQFGSIAERLLLGGIPAVVAMQFQVSQTAACIFSKFFYQALARGLSVQQSVTLARTEVEVACQSEWVTPALFMNGGDFALVESGR